MFSPVLAVSVYVLETKCSYRMASPQRPCESPGVQLSDSTTTHETCLRGVLFSQVLFCTPLTLHVPPTHERMYP